MPVDTVVVCAIMAWNGQNIFTITAIGVGANRDNDKSPYLLSLSPSRVRKSLGRSLLDGTAIG